MKNPQLVVMAAGIGSRYGGLKQVDPVGPSGEIVIDYSIHDAIKAGFDKVVFIIRKDIEETFREKIGRRIEEKIDTEYVFQELDKIPMGFKVPAERVKPWGTAHALLCAKDAIDAPFAVINADDFYGASSYKTIFDYLKNADLSGDVYDFCMVSFILENTITEHGYVSRGVCSATEDGYLAEIVERTKIQKFGDIVKFTEDGENWVEIDPRSLVSMNLWGFTPSLLDEFEQRFPKFLEANISNLKSEFFIPTVVNDLMSEGKAKVKVLKSEEKWLGVTYPEDKPMVVEAVNALVSNGVYSEKLWG